MKKTVEERFLQSLKEISNPDKDYYLVAVSGGVDSMVLLNLMYQNQLNFAVAHCNFQLRKEAIQEEKLVKTNCIITNSKFHSIKFETKTYKEEHKVSIQMAARELRYNWFKQLQEEFKYTKLVTAHHLNDNLETILLNLTKGTGINGLVGISPKNNDIIRPLLNISKQEIYEFSKKHNIEFLEDNSNFKNDYQRNKIRNQIIPILKEINPNLEKTIDKNIQLYKFNQNLQNKEIKKAQSNLIHKVENNTLIYINQLLNYPNSKIIFIELLKAYNFTSNEAINCYEKLKQSSTGAIFNSKTHSILLDRKKLIISNNKNEQNPIILINEIKEPTKVKFLNQEITFSIVSSIKKFEEKTIYINIDKIKYPLTLRTWIEGDYFYPFGLGKKQKLNKYFINNKFSRNQKQEVPILLSDNKIIAIIGHRLDDRFKINSNNNKILKVSVD